MSGAKVYPSSLTADDADDAVADYSAEEKVETAAEKKKREKREKAEKLAEFGGACSTRKLFSLASPFEFFVLFVGVFGAIGNGLGQMAINIFFGLTIDGAVDGTSLAKMRTACYYMFGLAGYQLVMAGLQGFAFPWFAERQVMKIKPLYFDAVLHRDVGWFDTHEPAALSTEMGAEVDEYVDCIGRKMGMSIMSGSIVVSGYALAFFYSWKIASVITAFLPLMTLAGPIMYSAMVDITEEKQGAYAKAALVVEECLFAVRTVAGFGGEQREIDRFEVAVERARKGGIKNRMKLGFGMGYFNFTMFSSYAVAFWFAFWLRENAEPGSDDAAVTAGDVIICFSGALMGGMMFGQMIPGYLAIQTSRVSLARFFHLIANESVIQRRVADDRAPLGDRVRTFELKDVHFSYPARPEQKILQGVSLTIQEGQKVAFVGESGSGKSTIMALLERFYDPNSGTVLVNGKDLRSLSVSSVRESIGYVGQEPVLFATTVRKNIRMGCKDATDEDVTRCVANAQMQEFVSKLPDGLDTYVGSGGSQFSGGQKQRIAIARALLKKPSVLFLDEATSALDSRSERQIQGTIDAIGRNDQLKMSIVSIAHRLSTIRNSDVIFVLKMGKVVESGSHAELVANPEGQYQALAAAQNMTLEGQGEGPVEAEQQASEEDPASLSEVKPTLERKQTKAEEEEEEKRKEEEILKTYKVPLGRLFQFCKPEWWMIPPGIIFGIVSGIPFIYVFVFTFTDAMYYLHMQDKSKLMREVFGFLILGGVKWVAMFAQYSFFGALGEAITKRVRVALLTCLLSQEIGFHDDPENTPAQLQMALQLYAMRISRLFIAIGDNCDAIATMVCGLTLAFVKCWQLSLAMLGSIPILIVCAMLDMASMKGAESTQTAAAKEAAQMVQDALTNSRTVHAGSNEKELVTMYEKIANGGISGVKVHLITGLGAGLSQMFQMAIMAASMLLMAYLIENGDTNFQDGFGAFMGILMAGFMAGMARAFTGDTNKATVACHNLFKLLDRESKINSLVPTGATPEAMQGIGTFELKDIKFYYPFRPDVEVLKGISFEIKAGTSVGVVGPSGGGKSTVFAMLQRFYDPQGGAVFIGEGASRMELSKVNIRWWRRQVGVVGQEPILFDGTVLDNVKYGVGPDEQISEAHLEDCKQKSFLTFLNGPRSQGWHTRVGPRGSRLSGGQKQRVAICRALVRNPKVLLLDEATSALDSKSEEVVNAALERAREGRTSFAIAHRLSTIQDCDVIVVVADGKVVEQGSHAELMDKGEVYFKLHESSKQH